MKSNNLLSFYKYIPESNITYMQFGEWAKWFVEMVILEGSFILPGN
jgi:hypothetical protein